MTRVECRSRSDAETQGLGTALARTLPETPPPRALRVHLSGDLGAGKTTLVRGLLQGRGVVGAVKSPTYGLLELYELPPWQVLHLDLYRLADPHDVAALGLADHDQPFTLWLIEWPERARGALPGADVEVILQGASSAHKVLLEGLTETGSKWLSRACLESEFSSAVP
jgi:tRNA threonylcarbamoyladenosine biosynthesis protein TsaE